MEKSVKLIPRELREMQFPEARFLTEEEQGKYEEAVKSFGEKARQRLDIPYKGSNLFKVLLLNQIGIRTATLSELDLIVENAPDFLRGTFEDAPAAVLRSAGDSYNPNDYVAKNLAKLIKRRSFPHAVVVEGLEVKEDNNSEYGLSFGKGEGFRVIEAPALDNDNNQRRFRKINPDYTIDFDDKAERTLYTRDEGVSGLFLGRALGLSSGDGLLANSDDDGHVVVVSAEGTAKNLDKYATNRKAIQEKYIADMKALRDSIDRELGNK